MSDSKTLNQALFAFQSEAPMILKSAENPFFKSKYADLPAVWNGVHVLLKKHGLLVTNQISIADSTDWLTTTVTHVPSNEQMISTLPINPAKRDPQGYGAAITYHRRQNLVAMLGLICDNDDDDGNAASEPAKAKKTEPKEKADPIREKIKGWITELKALQSYDEIMEFARKINPAMKDLSLEQVQFVNNQINITQDNLQKTVLDA